jgi:pimeloyl-ACP methyl ester carboxylesterase
MLKTFEYNNATISYRVEGKGKAVLLLHGFGEESSIWDAQVAFLQQHCRIITPDMPGSGRSDLRAIAGDSPTMEHYAAIILELLNTEKIDRCILLGHSMGGYIALAFAELYPERLEAFGLINSTAFADSAEKKQVRARAIETIGAHGAYSFLKTTIPTLFSTAFRGQHQEQISALIEKGKEFSKEALQQYYRAMMNRPDRTAVLKSNPLPVLFVIGTEDAPAPMNDVLQQTHLPDKSYIHVLQGIGHMSMLEAPDQLNKRLLAFINRP